MSLFPPKTVTLRDGAKLLLRSPEVEEARQLLNYLDTVRHETDGILYAPEDVLPTLEQERNWIRDKRDCQVGVHIAAEADGQVVALAGIDQPSFTRQKHLGSAGISIMKRWCDRGLGSYLMQELVDYACAESELQLLTLTVLSTNHRAQAVYKKVGFAEDGRAPNRIKIDGRMIDLISMSRWVSDKKGTTP